VIIIITPKIADGDTGNMAGYHGKLNTEPSHDSEVNDNGKQVGQYGNQSHFKGHLYLPGTRTEYADNMPSRQPQEKPVMTAVVKMTSKGR
jgi:hypothetical protein